MSNKEKLISRENGFLIPLLFWLFHYLEMISVFYWVRKIDRFFFERRKNKNDGRTKPFTSEYIFPEIWLLLNMIIAVAASPHILVKTNSVTWGYILGIYSMLRVFELVVYQINVLFFHRLNGHYLGTGARKAPAPRSGNNAKKSAKGEDTADQPGMYAIKSATRTVIMLILNMIEYVLQFAVMFQAIENITGYKGIAITIFDSFQLFMDAENLDVYRHSPLFYFAYIETMIGVFMNIVCLARFIGLLPDVKVKDNV